MRKDFQVSHEQALFLHQLLFFASNSASLGAEEVGMIDEIQFSLKDYLLGEDEETHSCKDNWRNYCDGGPEDEDEEEDDSDDRPMTDEYLYPQDFTGIPWFSAEDENREKVKLGFSIVGKDDLELEINKGEEILTDIKAVHRTGSSIKIMTGGNWRIFYAKKFPKELTGLLAPNVTFSIEVER